MTRITKLLPNSSYQVALFHISSRNYAILAPDIDKILHASSSHYDVLGISDRSSPEEIRKAWLAISRVYHPDKAPLRNVTSSLTVASEKDSYRLAFIRITDAYNVLSDTAKRNEYDNMLRMKKLEELDPDDEFRDLKTRKPTSIYVDYRALYRNSNHPLKYPAAGSEFSYRIRQFEHFDKELLHELRMRAQGRSEHHQCDQNGINRAQKKSAFLEAFFDLLPLSVVVGILLTVPYILSR